MEGNFKMHCVFKFFFFRISSGPQLLPVLANAELPSGYLSLLRKDLEKREVSYWCINNY